MLGNSIESEIREIQVDKLIDLHREHLKKTFKIRCLESSLILNNLVNTDESHLVCSFCSDLIKASPRPLPSHTKLKGKIVEITKSKSDQLMKSLHSRFEDQLSLSNEDHNSNSLDWKHFFSESRQRILAIAMLRMTNEILGETGNQLDEIYRQILDDALTPMWGRFYFHLSGARNTGSMRQFLWTFGYAKSFCELMSDLVGEIGGSTYLKEEFRLNFRDIGRNYVGDKITKFLKAHISHIISTMIQNHSDPSKNLSSCSKEFRHEIVGIIEAALDIQAHIFSVLSMENSLPCHYLLEVIYDIKPVHGMWIDFDRSYIFSRFEDLLPTSSFFLASFGDIWSSYHVPYKGFHCYRGLYECFFLFQFFAKRYRDLPGISQQIFSEAVLEPLLLFSVGLLVYRIRSCPVLFRASKNRKNSKRVASVGIGDVLSSSDDEDQLEMHTKNDEFQVMESKFMEFSSSCKYYLSCLTNVSALYQDINCTPSQYQYRWDNVFEALPRRLVPQRALDSGKFSLQNILRKCFTIEENYTNTDNTPKIISQEDVGAFLMNKKRHLWAEGTLGKVMEMTKEQISVVISTMETLN